MDHVTNLSLTCITPEQHARTCGYWYLVYRYGTSWTAFETKEGLYRWLSERGLVLLGAIPEKRGTFKSCIHIQGEYFDNMTFGELPPGKATKKLSNGDYVLATITEREGLRVISYHNPNVKTRLVFDYQSSRKEMD